MLSTAKKLSDTTLSMVKYSILTFSKNLWQQENILICDSMKEEKQKIKIPFT